MLASMLGVLLLAASAGLDRFPALEASAGQAVGHTDARVWSEFVAMLRAGTLSETHVRPAYASKETMLRFLAVMRDGRNDLAGPRRSRRLEHRLQLRTGVVHDAIREKGELKT